jgi:hypothetical protein
MGRRLLRISGSRFRVFQASHLSARPRRAPTISGSGLTMAHGIILPKRQLLPIKESRLSGLSVMILFCSNLRRTSQGISQSHPRWSTMTYCLQTVRCATYSFRHASSRSTVCTFGLGNGCQPFPRRVAATCQHFRYSRYSRAWFSYLTFSAHQVSPPSARQAKSLFTTPIFGRHRQQYRFLRRHRLNRTDHWAMLVLRLPRWRQPRRLLVVEETEHALAFVSSAISPLAARPTGGSSAERIT